MLELIVCAPCSDPSAAMGLEGLAIGAAAAVAGLASGAADRLSDIAQRRSRMEDARRDVEGFARDPETNEHVRRALQERLNERAKLTEWDLVRNVIHKPAPPRDGAEGSAVYAPSGEELGLNYAGSDIADGEDIAPPPPLPRQRDDE